MSSQLYPEVIDASTLGSHFAPPLFLPVAAEGAAASGAPTAVVGQPYSVSRASEVDGLFGSASSLAQLVKFLLARGVSPVVAVASVKGAYTDETTERAAAWANLESDENIRVRLTDSETEATLAALAESCANANLLSNKQFCVVGRPSGTSKAGLITSAGAIAAGGNEEAQRSVLVGPGVYDETGTLKGGAFAAAQVAAAIALNPDIADDLDTYELPNLTGIEKDAFGLPIFRRRVTAGVVVNDFEDLLDDGVSPLEQGPNGGVRITHLRTTYVTDGSYDSLMTRLIVDQVFLDVKSYARDNEFLRRGNTDETREALRSGVDALLQERSNWILPKTQADGSTGYNVAVVASSDQRKVTVSYEGTVVRGISVIEVAASLDISA